MTIRLLTTAVCCAAVLSGGSAAAHEGIPRTWWLGTGTALRQLDAKEQRWVSGRCVGLAPRATRGRLAVYKHFTCTGRLQAGALRIPATFRVHVVGPRGRIAVGP